MRHPGRRYWMAVATVPVLLLALYGLAAGLQLPLVGEPRPSLLAAGALAGLLGFGLLVADVVLPVPSSVVMAGNGAVLGAAAGAIVSIAGRAAGFAFGYWLGSTALPLARRLVPSDDLASAAALLERRGWIAILLSRPVPILSETVSMMAGLSRVPLPASIAAATIGSLPEAVIFAFVGSSLVSAA